MTKTDIIDYVIVKTGMSRKVANEMVNATFTGLFEALSAGEQVWITDFGTFEVRRHAARTGRNPQTGEKIEIASHNTAIFRSGKALKDAINRGSDIA